MIMNTDVPTREKRALKSGKIIMKIIVHTMEYTGEKADSPEATDNCPVKHCPIIKRSATPVIPLKLMETHLYIRTLFLFVSKK